MVFDGFWWGFLGFHWLLMVSVFLWFSDIRGYI